MGSGYLIKQALKPENLPIAIWIVPVVVSVSYFLVLNAASNYSPSYDYTSNVNSLIMLRQLILIVFGSFVFSIIIQAAAIYYDKSRTKVLVLLALLCYYGALYFYWVTTINPVLK